MGETTKESVRSKLAKATAKQHESLHSHPWIASMLDPGLTIQKYCLVLSAYLRFFQAVEATRVRMGGFPDCSLESSIEALIRDTEDLHPLCLSPVPIEMTHAERSLDALIGVLYVVHGAGFGARTLCSAVRSTLPEAKCSYLSAGTPPKLWRSVLDELECLGGNSVRQQIAIDSAARTFLGFGRFVTSYCEIASTRARVEVPSYDVERHAVVS